MRKYVLGIVVLLVMAGFSIFYINARGAQEITAVEDNSASTPPALSEKAYTPPYPAPSDPQGFNRYQNTAHKFSLLYPNDLGVREYKESADSMSATFESPDGSKGFQIYVTKYTEPQITPERFKLDQPSGVRDAPTDVIVDGTRATMFFGRNSVMGDTREVWFIREGFLYEVTTYRELDAWLAQIMQTWKFK